MAKATFLIVLFVAMVSGTVAKLPEQDLYVPDLIKYWNYPVEVHEAKTDDGYYLTLHRIPHGRNQATNLGAKNKKRPAVFLQHGLLASSSNWVVNFPDDSLGFMLADSGYDVWMGNVRGNTYSKKHETLDVNSDAFWDFSFDEMAKYDLPAMLMYVLQNTTQKQLYYVGHSQGTMMIFAGLSTNKVLQQRIKAVFALAPVTRLKHVYSPMRYLVNFQTIINVVMKMFRVKCFMPSNKFFKLFAAKICPLDRRICSTMVSLMAGYDTKDFNSTRMPIYMSHTPAGTSIKNVNHFAQLISSQKFQMYDYGYVTNLLRYHSLWAPTYHFENIDRPMVIISGSNDWLAPPSDVLLTAEQLPGLVSIHQVKGYNHLDFIWGMSAKTEVYERIMKTLSYMEKN